MAWETCFELKNSVAGHFVKFRFVAKQNSLTLTPRGAGAHDLSTTNGFLVSILAILSIQCGGLVHLATVCTSFTLVNSGTHRRTLSQPLGRSDLAYVDLGTCLASRSSLLALLAWALGGTFILEQPRASLMTALPSWQWVLAFFQQMGNPIQLSSVNMACFRAPTLKPTALYSPESLGLLMGWRVPPKRERPAVDEVAWKTCLGPDFHSSFWLFLGSRVIEGFVI